MEAMLASLIKNVLKEDVEKDIKEAYNKFKKTAEYKDLVKNSVKREAQLSINQYFDSSLNEMDFKSIDVLINELIDEDTLFKSLIKKTFKQEYLSKMLRNL